MWEISFDDNAFAAFPLRVTYPLQAIVDCEFSTVKKTQEFSFKFLFLFRQKQLHNFNFYANRDYGCLLSIMTLDSKNLLKLIVKRSILSKLLLELSV